MRKKSKKKTKAEKAEISRKIWESRRKNAATKKKFDTKTSAPKPSLPPDMPSADVPPVPYLENTAEFSFSKETYSLSQVKDLGLFAHTTDGERFRFLRIKGQYVKEERHQG